MDRERIGKLVPENKFDFHGMEELKMLSDEEIAFILPELLGWMRDMNWPVAREMPTLLAGHQKVLAPCLIEVLQPGQPECDWKNYIIGSLLPLLGEECLLAIKPCLERIAKEPTREEIEEETDLAAEQFIRDIK